MTIEQTTLDLEQTKEREALWTRGREIVLSSSSLYLDVDIEADGIAGFGSMLAIGAQSPTGESFYSEMRPSSPDYISSNRRFCEDHKLGRERLLKEAPAMEDVMLSFHDWVTSLEDTYGKPPIFTAFNAAFDFPFVDLNFLKAGTNNPFGIAPLDLKSLAIVLTPNWNFKETSKGKLPGIILPDGDFTHNALEDAQYQQKIHYGLAALIERQQIQA